MIIRINGYVKVNTDDETAENIKVALRRNIADYLYDMRHNPPLSDDVKNKIIKVNNDPEGPRNCFGYPVIEFSVYVGEDEK